MELLRHHTVDMFLSDRVQANGQDSEPRGVECDEWSNWGAEGAWRELPGGWDMWEIVECVNPFAPSQFTCYATGRGKVSRSFSNMSDLFNLNFFSKISFGDANGRASLVWRF
jgi:hypothetical protein